MKSTRQALGPRGLSLLIRETPDAPVAITEEEIITPFLSTDSAKSKLRILLYLLRRSHAKQSLPSFDTRANPEAARTYLNAHPFHPRYYHIDCWDATGASLSDLKNNKAAQADRLRMEYHRRLR